ncbi:hypothetical protein ACP70R_039637 [Stipagrostis hirtigluma subsp. patula]
MSRRSVYLLVENIRQGTFALRRINMAGFFYPTKPPNGSLGAAATNHAAACSANNPSTSRIEDARLPRPVITFRPPSSEYDAGSMQFMRFSRHGGENHIIGADQRRNVISYDADAHTVHVMPRLNYPKNSTAVSLTVSGNLYVINSFHRPCSTQCFEALIYGRPSQGKQSGRPDWHWHSLPPPPYVFEPGYQLPPSNIRSYTAIGDSKILVSAKDIGTYSFDTASREWSKAGDWLLPFSGHAEYVPEHDLWFGLSYADDHRLCASAGLSAASEFNPPALRHVWEADLDTPKDWVARMAYAVHLGSGRFCIARFFQRALGEEPQEYGFDCREYESFAVFTGVEVRRRGMASGGGELGMVIHRSKRYKFVNEVFEWVL